MPTPEVFFMDQSVKSLMITYYHHSGFSCALGDTLLVFDYWTGEHGELPEERRITREMLEAYRQVYVFISHAHLDHYDPVVYTWQSLGNVRYILSDDMRIAVSGDRMKPGSTLTLNQGLTVKAFESTDLGVAFLVEIDGIRIFHAGDLNFWHWRDESSVREIAEAEEDFNKAIEPLRQEKIDVAFFPVDPRQGMMYDAGANTFIMSIKPRLMIPMHFWGRRSIASEFARHSRTRDTGIMALTRFGEQLQVDFAENGHMTVRPLTPPDIIMPVRPESALPVVEPRRHSTDVDLDTLSEQDPFSDTDLPVTMEE